MVAIKNNTDTVQIRENKVTQLTEGTKLKSSPSKIKTVIDIGTTKISAIMGQLEKGRLNILTHSTVPCDGLRKGIVTDISGTSRAIKLAIEKIESLSGYKVDSAYVGVTGVHVSFTNRRDLMNRDEEPYVITKDSLTDNPDTLFASIDNPERKLIHAITMSYCVDGDEGIRNPVGMHSDYVEVDTHVVTGSAELLDKLNTSVESAGIKVSGMVLEPIASGIAVSTKEEREQGVVVIDIGGGTTDLIAFKNSSVCYTDVIPVGGFQFTNDIALTFNTHYESAESAKLEYGTAELYPSNRAESKISFQSKTDDSVIEIESDDISQLTRERAQELINLIRITLNDSELDAQTKSHIVLTGGTSNLPGLTDLMGRTIATKVRTGLPIADGIPEELLNPNHATGVGILKWVLKNDNKENAINNKIDYSSNSKKKTGILSRIGQIIKK